jgi:predicted  nucleic acid-binding Zn-ribbon protein
VQEVIEKFIGLQKMEDEIGAFAKIIEDGPRRISQSLEAWETAKGEHDESALALEAARKRLRELELDLLKFKELATGNKVRMTKVTDDKSYRAILSEADKIRQRVSEAENETLSLMAEEERLRGILPEAETRMLEAQKAHLALEKETLAAVAVAEAEAASRRKAIEETLAGIDPALAGQYSTSSRIHDGRTMAPVRDGTCGACRMRIPPQLFNELQTNEKLMLCPNCARLMYWLDHPAWAPPAPPEEPEETKKPKGKAPKRAKKPRSSAGA